MTHQDEPETRRAALAAKRDALYAQQAQRTARQRHAEEVADFHRYHGAALEAAGARFELLWDTDTRRGPLTRYPIGFASVHWSLVPHAVVEHGATQAHLAELLERALHALRVAPASTVIVDWGVSRMPRVVLSSADACTHAIALMRGGSDMWVYAEEGAWLVEVHHDDRVTYADRPGLPEHAGEGWRQG
ncbi:hypothetical protein LF41_2920 [Lysobacter dokdonensis DS-58]|uniref:Uncharacterized protein n=1 Tax=Lysobacter dokdonensis DS-58 TaxID=1300345 RepID=A0A0A2X232_9GAMM|nr:hypothetical protein [Lysobacter dokdonensis]KGQ19274.1 hypothetical protein LF41_2920 [Lysobacter dokdonensis DS-58]